jgi:hypothetical protein
MVVLFGVILLMLGVAILIWGGRGLSVRDGEVLRLVSLSPSRAKIVQWAIAFAAFYCGIGLILGWWY